jgi:hypothetical protein
VASYAQINNSLCRLPLNSFGVLSLVFAPGGSPPCVKDEGSTLSTAKVNDEYRRVPAREVPGYRDSDPWLVLRGPIGLNTPGELLMHLGYIRYESEWRRNGIRVIREGSNIKPIVNNGLWFGFTQPYLLNEFELAALTTNKRAIYTYNEVDAFLSIGGSRDELVELPEHIWIYHEAAEALRADDLMKAGDYFGRAVLLAPAEVRYRERWYDVRIEVGDLSALPELLNYFKDDVDSVVHNDLAYRSLKLLLRKCGIEQAQQFYLTLKEGLERQTLSKPAGRIYSGWSPDFINAKSQQLDRAWLRLSKPRRKQRNI